MRRATPRDGFTLFELLVAAALVAFLAAAILAILSTASSAQRRIEARAQRREVVDGLFDWIAVDFSNAVRTGSANDGGFRGIDDFEFDDVQFMTMSGRPDGRRAQPYTDFRNIHYFYEPDHDAEIGPGLVREEISLMTGTSVFVDDLAHTSILSDEPIGFDLEYFDGTSWVPEWDSEAEEGMPEMVKIVLHFEPLDLEGRPEEEEGGLGGFFGMNRGAEIAGEPELHTRYVRLGLDRDFGGE